MGDLCGILVKGKDTGGAGWILFNLHSHGRACRENTSPVWIASQGGHLSCVEALIRAKANVLQCNR